MRNDDTIENGGQAFPGQTCDGMSMRDYFAAAALQGLIARTSSELACHQLNVERKKQGVEENEVERVFAKCAYDYAEAMLKARGV